MIKRKVKTKIKSKTKAKKISKKTLMKVKNPVYLDFYYRLKEAYDKYHKLKNLILDDAIVLVYSNNNIVGGLLKSDRNYDYVSYDELLDSFISRPYRREKVLNDLNKELYLLNTLNYMPNRDDLSLIAETDDYLGNELFWNEHNEFKKDKFKKSSNFLFRLENVDKIIDNKIYVRRLKEHPIKNF